MRPASDDRGLAQLAAGSSGRAAWRAPLLLAIVAVIAGILAMHAFSVGHQAPGPAAAHTTLDGHYHDGSNVGLPVQHASGTAAALTTAPTAFLDCGPNCTGDHGMTAAVCVAALTVLLLAGRPRQLSIRARAYVARATSRDIPLLAHRCPARAPTLAGLCILRI